MKVLAVLRDPRFSPNSVEKDEAIMLAVLDRLHGCHINKVWEAELTGREQADMVLAMARSGEALRKIAMMEERGARVYNPAEGVRACRRSNIDRIMRTHGIPMPPDNSGAGWWLKRGDASAQSHDDVVFCHDSHSLEQAKARFGSRGITDMVVSAHVEGDLVKFYGVRGTAFFHTCYPTDDGQTKFGDEAHNGASHHYPYDRNALKAQATRLAGLVGTPIYGGDCIVCPGGDFKIIDFNDWPSFSRCREEAAQAIIQMITDEQI